MSMSPASTGSRTQVSTTAMMSHGASASSPSKSPSSGITTMVTPVASSGSKLSSGASSASKMSSSGGATSNPSTKKKTTASPTLSTPTPTEPSPSSEQETPTINPTPVVTHCEPKVNCAAEVQYHFLTDAADDICDHDLARENPLFNPTSKPITRTVTDPDTSMTFNITVSWIPGCTAEKAHFHDSIDCSRALLAPYNLCLAGADDNNVGGSATSGCVRYDVAVDCTPDVPRFMPTCKPSLNCPGGINIARGWWQDSRAAWCDDIKGTRMHPGDPPWFRRYAKLGGEYQIVFRADWVKGCRLLESQPISETTNPDSLYGHVNLCEKMLDAADEECSDGNDFAGFTMLDRCVRVEMMGKCCYGKEQCEKGDPLYGKEEPD
ncbi:hypothetical protein EJ05DRAFT_480025 [Pseudovirgaria hyperparasitica]|uniref:Uncharacterized protein n=1 Tax=Pseudovirgaria hyperparasitica TaxID=470096 RepID=A0A6A6VVX9_9PEZI|nr:uncharacterized protein EJ05DRAFT_480025 [Pseudovirgaria hyperparasitica]KAF2754019.1 hypothetical protein EJ05DRAFT_480025 [Pseudovirgaria hyperparasitica]